MVREWYLHNPLTLVAVRDGYTGEVIAHLNLLPITGELYGEFHEGVRGDTDIPIA